jgi:hypothetical protein
MINIGVITDVRQIEKDIDLGGLYAQPLGGRPDLAMVDDRTVGRDTEIPSLSIPRSSSGLA